MQELDRFQLTEHLPAPVDLPVREALDAVGPLALVRTDAPEIAAEHTANHVNCPGCHQANVALQGVKANFAALPFAEAASYWMQLRAQSSLKPRTHEATSQYLDALGRFFHALRLTDITPGHIRSYQLARLSNLVRAAGRDTQPWKNKAGNSLVNHEISVIGQMLRHCRLWHRIQPFYFPLPVKGWSPRTILSEHEEDRLFTIAAKHPEASLAYWVATITNNTSASGIELRGLRMKHIFLPNDGIAEIYIPEDSVKNNSRPRKIPLNPAARWAVEKCYRRALEIGCCDPDDLLFPFRIAPGRWNTRRRASRSFLRKSWDKLRKATGFHELCPHQLRHHCITRLLENDVNPETVRAIAGHVTPKMMEYYAHQRTRVKYAAVLAIETKKKPPASELALPALSLKQAPHP